MEDTTLPMSTSSNDLAELGGRKLVYIRAIPASDVMGDLESEFGDVELDFEADATIYSVHAADGERIALVGDRDLAFAAARQYEMNPVSVH
ncbi:MAG: hypothetical protein DHS20C05_10160 [Hyphococcus sp.]|nr:MAG: hypothetical protein DHS20C05_10160 [Marinicaulis sp.]